MSDPIYDPDLIWLRDGYLSEMPIVQWLAGEAELHLEMGGNSANGIYRRWADRIAGDSFMGDFRKILLPFHEAVKRLGRTPESRWLRMALNYRGLPCLCAHPRLTAHIADMERTQEDRVVSGIRYALRRAMVRLEVSGDVDKRGGTAKFPAGRRGLRADKRTLATTDTVGAMRDPRPSPPSHAGGVGEHRYSEKKVADAPLCACHAHLHGRPPKDARESAA